MHTLPAPAPLYLDLPHNPQQLLPASIRHSQLWDRKLKAAAAALIDDPAAWLPLYHLWDMRTAKGATGLLFRSWPHDWQVRPWVGGWLRGVIGVIWSAGVGGLRHQRGQLPHLPFAT